MVAVAVVAAIAVAIPAFASGSGAQPPGATGTATVVGVPRHCPAIANPALRRALRRRARHGRAACILTCVAPAAATPRGAAGSTAAATCVLRVCPAAARDQRAICIACLEPGHASGATIPPHIALRCIPHCVTARTRSADSNAPGVCLPPCVAIGATGSTGASGTTSTTTSTTGPGVPTAVWVCPRPCPPPVATGTTSATGSTGMPAIWACPLPCPQFGATGASGATVAVPQPALLPRLLCPPPCLATGATGATGATTAPALCLPPPCAAAHGAMLGRWCGPGLPPCGPPVAGFRRGAGAVRGVRRVLHAFACPAATAGAAPVSA